MHSGGSLVLGTEANEVNQTWFLLKLLELKVSEAELGHWKPELKGCPSRFTSLWDLSGYHYDHHAPSRGTAPSLSVTADT